MILETVPSGSICSLTQTNLYYRSQRLRKTSWRAWKMMRYILTYMSLCMRKTTIWISNQVWHKLVTNLYRYRSRLEAWNFGLKKKRDWTVCVSKTKTPMHLVSSHIWQLICMLIMIELGNEQNPYWFWYLDIWAASWENQQYGFRTSQTQSEMYKHRRSLEAGNFGSRK